MNSYGSMHQINDRDLTRMMDDLRFSRAITRTDGRQHRVVLTSLFRSRRSN